MKNGQLTISRNLWYNFHPQLVSNQCAMERLILLLLGLNLRTQDGSSLDFEYSSNLLKKGIEIIRGVFGNEEGNTAGYSPKEYVQCNCSRIFQEFSFQRRTQFKPWSDFN